MRHLPRACREPGTRARHALQVTTQRLTFGPAGGPWAKDTKPGAPSGIRSVSEERKAQGPSDPLKNSEHFKGERAGQLWKAPASLPGPARLLGPKWRFKEQVSSGPCRPPRHQIRAAFTSA